MPFTTYKDAVDYLYAALPMFQRVGAAALKKDLSNTIRLCDALGNPERKFKSIHVAGTNGKGSVSHMMASVLQSAGYKTGLYTSPHLKEFTERIKINGEEIDQEFIIDFVNRIQPQIEMVKPSFFEITVVMAFDYFVRIGIDIAVIEVGMGGRLDSTNVIDPELSIITNIGLDHKDLLGDTMEKIASEKAGIIKEGKPVVISEHQPEIKHVFASKARELGSPIEFAWQHYTCDHSESGYTISKEHSIIFHNLDIPLRGDYQTRNIPAVFTACDILRGRGFNIFDDQLQYGLLNVSKQTGFKGRWQKLGEEPLIICDTGHNAEGIKIIVDQIKGLKFDRLFVVMGVVKDKDPTEVLKLLPRTAYYYFCQAKIPRAMDAIELQELASSVGLEGEAVPDVRVAIRSAKKRATNKDFIFIGGSTFVVAEIEEL